LANPIAVAAKGKGYPALVNRARAIGRRYGLGPAKMDHTLRRFVEILEEFGCGATFPITASVLARHGLTIQKYQSHNIEFAIHGYLHVDYSQLSAEEQISHFRKATQVFRDQGIRYDGFRSPYLRWNEHTLMALGQAGFGYDSSTSLGWDIEERHVTESYERALSFYTAKSAAEYLALPEIDSWGGLVRVPYCLPDDEALVERLNWSGSHEMNRVWPAISNQIHQRGELFCLGLHPERIAECSEALVATLRAVHAMGPAVWRACLRDIVAWWKARADATLEISDVENHVLQLCVNGPTGVTLMLRSLDVKTAVEPWFDGYQLATEMPCIVRVNRRPFIGVSPDAAPSMISFLNQQGYIVETALNVDVYPLYLDSRSFSREDERLLVAQIEGADFPLARLGRWPNGARSAFCVTGDIDALTLWDYGLRLFGR
jgi:peptidoglycan/xylan/chitin deacetylase (PgdA/CDA1 family)